MKKERIKLQKLPDGILISCCCPEEKGGEKRWNNLPILIHLHRVICVYCLSQRFCDLKIDSAVRSVVCFRNNQRGKKVTCGKRRCKGAEPLNYHIVNFTLKNGGYTAHARLLVSYLLSGLTTFQAVDCILVSIDTSWNCYHNWALKVEVHY